MPSSLKGIESKLERARHHLEDARAVLGAYSVGDEILREIHPDSGMLMLKARIPPLPDAIALTIGDCVHNLRSALDHLIWQLVLANRKIPHRSNMFPICRTSEEFEKRINQNRLKGVYPNAQKAIERLQPYTTGDDILQVVSDLDNADKHRTLLVAICLVTKQEYRIKHPATGDVICYGATIGSRIRDGSLILGINPTAASIPDNPIIESERDSLIVFNEDPPSRDREVVPTLEAAISYVELAVIPSLRPWLV
jgi:hypothetical protein